MLNAFWILERPNNEIFFFFLNYAVFVSHYHGNDPRCPPAKNKLVAVCAKCILCTHALFAEIGQNYTFSLLWQKGFSVILPFIFCMSFFLMYINMHSSNDFFLIFFFLSYKTYCFATKSFWQNSLALPVTKDEKSCVEDGSQMLLIFFRIAPNKGNHSLASNLYGQFIYIWVKTEKHNFGGKTLKFGQNFKKWEREKKIKTVLVEFALCTTLCGLKTVLRAGWAPTSFPSASPSLLWTVWKD